MNTDLLPVGRLPSDLPEVRGHTTTEEIKDASPLLESNISLDKITLPVSIQYQCAYRLLTSQVNTLEMSTFVPYRMNGLVFITEITRLFAC